MPFTDSILATHPEWHVILKQAIQEMDPDYLQQLKTNNEWLPGKSAIFAAFSMPLSQTRYILLGESPYPREQSANGYAFWDNAVGSLWAETGFSKVVNRATSLRNLLKMLLHARGDLRSDFSQSAIASLDKSCYIKTACQLFNGFMQHGFLLLNASLVYSKDKVPYHARQWRLFMASLFHQLAIHKPSLQLVLLGRIAHQVPEANLFLKFEAEHPYNISFITNPNVIGFFQPFNLLGNSAE
ncbi:MAG: uracil-DNA glycosylase [Legionellaceae bacterium]|nr:uracil-DNA glycosylase [Legionellaceae bacterium]